MKIQAYYYTALTVLFAGLYAIAPAAWTDISTTQIAALGGQSGTNSFERGCAGIGVNRLNGDVYLKINGKGVFKSANQGSTWARIDNNTIDNSTGGRCETGWAFQVDQDNPTRMAVFTLDGDAGYTADGTTWKKFAGMGRNWDYGSVDWGSADRKVIIATLHESGGKVYKSTDGGSSWQQMNITIVASGGGATSVSMVGIINTNTYIYSVGNGILRSTDGGSNWTQVSTRNPASHTATIFKSKCYLCTSTGLLVSADNGATWATQGASTNLLWGPFFGADENNIVAASTAGLYRTTNGGTNWTIVSTLPTTTSFYAYNNTWYGGFSWDPVNNILYAAAMSNPGVKNPLATGVVNPSLAVKDQRKGFSVHGNRIQSDCPFTGFEIYSLSGKILYRWNGKETRSAIIQNLADIAPASSMIVLSTVSAGTIQSRLAYGL
jgi:hypothetical protein